MAWLLFVLPLNILISNVLSPITDPKNSTKIIIISYLLDKISENLTHVNTNRPKDRKHLVIKNTTVNNYFYI